MPSSGFRTLENRKLMSFAAKLQEKREGQERRKEEFKIS